MNLRRARVLVVDDNPHALDILAQMLLGFGVQQMQRATTAAEARDLVEAEVFDLMLIDAELPDQSGFDLVRQVRRSGSEASRTTAIILISGFTPRSKVERARDCGASLVLTKPITPSLLLDHIGKIASAHRPFVVADGYCGPDRRFKHAPLPPDQEERRADAIAMAATPERALSQDEVNALFG